MWEATKVSLLQQRRNTDSVVYEVAYLFTHIYTHSLYPDSSCISYVAQGLCVFKENQGWEDGSVGKVPALQA